MLDSFHISILTYEYYFASLNLFSPISFQSWSNHNFLGKYFFSSLSYLIDPPSGTWLILEVSSVLLIFAVSMLWLKDLFLNYVCFPYIQVPGDYTDPCDYIEIIKNIAYKTLINTYYRATKRLDFPKTKVK